VVQTLEVFGYGGEGLECGSVGFGGRGAAGAEEGDVSIRLCRLEGGVSPEESVSEEVFSFVSLLVFDELVMQSDYFGFTHKRGRIYCRYTTWTRVSSAAG